MADNLRFAVSGAPGAGKTTVLAELAERGFVVVPETAREIIRERRARGLAPRPEPPEFARAILERDVERYRGAPTDRPTLFDRSVVDALGMLRETGTLSGAGLAGYLREYPFNAQAFVFPAWREIYVTDAERDQTFAQAERVAASVAAWYAQCGYDVVVVAPASVSERADFIAAQIARAIGG